MGRREGGPEDGGEGTEFSGNEIVQSIIFLHCLVSKGPQIFYHY